MNYYQNHRRYVKSRDDKQLLGKTDRVVGECQPFQKTSNGTDADYTPCGAIANSRFNGCFDIDFFLSSSSHVLVVLDTLQLTFNGIEVVPFSNLGIAWSTDKAVKFKNPPDPATCRPSHVASSFHLSLSLSRFQLSSSSTELADHGMATRPVQWRQQWLPKWGFYCLDAHGGNANVQKTVSQVVVEWLRNVPERFASRQLYFDGHLQ